MLTFTNMKKTAILCLVTSLAIMSMLSCSCGPTVKVMVKGTKDGVNITTTQSSSDSTSLNIEVNPNINFSKPLISE